MRFSFNTAVTATLALLSSSNVAAQLTKDAVVNNINAITSLSQSLQTPANSINLLSGPLFLIGQGPFPPIITGFTQIITDVSGDIQAMQIPVSFSGQDATDIYNAFSDFVQVHQALLSILIGKAGILSIVPIIGSPISAVLRSLEGVVDTVSLSLAGMITDYATQVASQTAGLDTSLNQAITAYEGIQLKKRTSRYRA